jgi:uncharacterized membrane protein YphA (DoxX/SURF4 family)
MKRRPAAPMPATDLQPRADGRVQDLSSFEPVVVHPPTISPTMKILTVIARLLLGLGFVVFGSNAFLHFIPMPPIPQTLAGDFTRVFINSGYATVIGVLQLISGLLLLIGRFVPLALTILGAIIFNILVFHALMAPEGFPPGLVVTVLELFLLWRYREAFLPLLKP